MHAAGIDTHALLQAGLIASLEGAMIYGVFHGDLHGGNLGWCSPTAAPRSSTSA